MTKNNKEFPLVSVIMPVYNGDRTIEFAIQSLFLQTFSNWICVIVNDCSTDNTANILRKFEVDHRFKIIHLQKNQGRGNARQIALENAEGKYLTFLDADDFYHPQKLEYQVAVLEKYPSVELVSTGIASFDLKKEIRSVRALGNNTILRARNKYKYPFFPASTMLRIVKAKTISYNSILDVGEDFDFLRNYLGNGEYFMMNKVLYYYEEVGVITFKKLMKYQFSAICSIHITSRTIVELIGRYLIRSLKIIYYLVITSFMGIESVIEKRGRRPSQKEIKEFFHTLYNIRSYRETVED